MADLVIGADLGGTSTRVALADADGALLATASAGGGNPTSHGADRAAAELGIAVKRALDGFDPRRVRAAVLGVAGAGALDDPGAARLFDEAVGGSGLAVRPDFLSDAEVAYCSATPRPSGTLLLAGTGAKAARVRDRRVQATADGFGWLLGDHGSGFWLGREAVRAVLAAIDGTGPETSLTGTVPGRLLDRPLDRPAYRRRYAVIRAVAARPPVALAGLAVLVAEAEAAGDEVATSICDRAAAHLVRTIGEVREPGERGPLVLNGGVVRSPHSPVGRRVRRLIAERFAGEVLTPADGIAGAVWLAVRAARPQWSEERLAAIHARLTGA
ncbi:BadF/BadG/BcrA/BcrD ATPase family protein [Rugosimonospora acidiphila]|uniref:BadF/BadG/BcrA/BcrD ATPase family protein n=1 Tax=Rugosimonospora acidiphila TaxID=556531 RepID=A0ABP9SED5_9ACTN